MIKPWIFEFFPELSAGADSAPEAVTQYFDDYFDLWTQAEARGFEGIFFSEHHFGGAYGGSPNLLIAALANRTRTLRLGVMGVVTPYYQPWRVVEEIGMLDHITHGRLEIGTAVGIFSEMAAINMSLEEARERNDETISVLDQALANGTVTHHGKHYRYDNLRLLPRTRQQPAPPVWTTVVSTESAQKAARRGSKICTGFNPVEKIKAVFDAYLAAARAAGFTTGADHLALRRRVTLGTSDSEAKELSHAVSERVKQTMAKNPLSRDKAVPDAPPAKTFQIGEHEFISGTPARVAEQIIEQCRHVGAGHFLAVLHWGAQFEEVARGHALFASEVIPLLRKASIPA